MRGAGSIFGECFAPLFAIDDAERTGTIHAVPLAQPTIGELKLRKRASPARFLRCAWSAATEPVPIGSFFGCLQCANDAFRSENLQMMCLQRMQHALVIKEEVATTTFLSSLQSN